MLHGFLKYCNKKYQKKETRIILTVIRLKNTQEYSNLIQAVRQLNFSKNSTPPYTCTFYAYCLKRVSKYLKFFVGFSI